MAITGAPLGPSSPSARTGPSAGTRTAHDLRLPAAARFARARDRVHDRLPRMLGTLIPATAIGFGVLSALTYALDLALLALGFDILGLPYPVAVTVGYVVAFGLSFLLNRWLNFQSRGDVRRQTGRYLLTVVANYVLFILLLSSTLEALGVHFLMARVIAGTCEGVFIYLMMRLYIFATRRGR